MRNMTALWLAGAMLVAGGPQPAWAEGAVVAAGTETAKPVANVGTTVDERADDDLVAPNRGKPQNTVGGATRSLTDEKKTPKPDTATAAPKDPPH